MNYQELIDEISKSESFKSLVTEHLAEKAVKEYYFQDSEGLLIKHEIREYMKKEAEAIIKDFFESYYETKNIQRIVEDIVRNMTKDRIIDLLKNKL